LFLVADVSQAIGKAKKPRKTNKRGRSSATDLTVDASTPVSAEIAQDTPPAQEEAPEPATGDASAGAAQPRRQLTYEEKVAIIAAYECGKTYSEIAQAFGRYVSTISRFIQHYKATRSFECKTGRGSKRKTSEKDDKALVRIVMHDRFLTSRKVMEALPTLTVSQRTVRRRIAELSRFKTIPNTSVV
jgi:transposase